MYLFSLSLYLCCKMYRAMVKGDVRPSSVMLVDASYKTTLLSPLSRSPPSAPQSSGEPERVCEGLETGQASAGRLGWDPSPRSHSTSLALNTWP